jgi:hypothetical protein
MKRIILMITGLGCLVFSACQKEQVKPNDFFIGANIGTLSWIAQPSTAYVGNRDSLQISGSYSDGSQKLTMKIPFAGIGTYTLTNNQATYTLYSVAGGVSTPVAQYQLDNTQTNTVSLNQSNVYVETGSFQLSFVKVSGSGTAPANVSFTNGKFWVALPNID